MTFREKLFSDRFLITSEVGPPKGIQTQNILERLECLRSRVDAINVTDLQSSIMRMGSLAMSVILRQHGFEPILQLTCRDRNRLALQSDLLSAAGLGIENVLILTGDHPVMGDHPEAKPVFDLDAVGLLGVARQLQEGRDMKGNPLEGTPPRFLIGAAVNPGADPLEPEIIKMEKKAAAGVDFFQTQAVFDTEVFSVFLEKTKHLAVPVMAGIVLLKSPAMARYMNDHVAGITVPDRVVRRIASAEDKKKACVEIAADLIRTLRPLCRGVHLMPLGWDRVVVDVLDAAGL